MRTTEERLALIEEKQKNDHEGILELTSKIEKLDDRMNKTDITLATMSINIEAIKDITTKISEYQEDQRSQTEEDMRSFKMYIIKKLLEVASPLILGAWGIYELINMFK